MCLLPSSSSTSDKDFAKKRESRRESKFAHDRDIDVERKAEAWRQRPVFELGEVTMTSLGGCFSSVGREIAQFFLSQMKPRVLQS